MKKNMKLMFKIITFLSITCILGICINVNAESGNAGGSGAGNTGYGGNSAGMAPAISPGGKVVQGIRITAYDVNGNRISNSYDYVNSEDVKNKLLNNNVQRTNIKSGVGKIDYLNNKDVNINSSVNDYGLKVLNFDNIIGSSAKGGTVFRDWFLGLSDSIRKSIDNDIEIALNDNIRRSGYYYAVEPMTYVTLDNNKYHFFLTSYEIFSLMTSDGGNRNLGDVMRVYLPRAIFVEKGQELDTEGFIGNIITTITKSNAENCGNNSSECKNLVRSRAGYGIGLFWTKGVPICDMYNPKDFIEDKNGNISSANVINVNCCEYFTDKDFGAERRQGLSYDDFMDLHPECGKCEIVPGEIVSDAKCTDTRTITFGQKVKSGDKTDLGTCLKANVSSSWTVFTRTTSENDIYCKVSCAESINIKLPGQITVANSSITSIGAGTTLEWPTLPIKGKTNYELIVNAKYTCTASFRAGNLDPEKYNIESMRRSCYNLLESVPGELRKISYVKDDSFMLGYTDDEFGYKDASKQNMIKTKLVKDSTTSDSSWKKSRPGNGNVAYFTQEIKYKLNSKAEEDFIKGSFSAHRNDIDTRFLPLYYKNTRFGYLPISIDAEGNYRTYIFIKNIGRTPSFYKKTIGKEEVTYSCPYNVSPYPNDCSPDDENYPDCSVPPVNSCVCPKNTDKSGIDLTSVLRKNYVSSYNKMTCAMAQAKYCNNGKTIEYRVIELSNPFPGIASNGRAIGSNWRDGNDGTTIFRIGPSGANNTNFEVVTKYITNNRTMKEGQVYTATPMYSFNLNANTINVIRNYNSSNDYDDFKLECINRNKNSVNGSIVKQGCISSFVHNKNNGLIGGTCSNLTMYSSLNQFNDCQNKPR